MKDYQEIISEWQSKGYPSMIIVTDKPKEEVPAKLSYCASIVICQGEVIKDRTGVLSKYGIVREW